MLHEIYLVHDVSSVQHEIVFLMRFMYNTQLAVLMQRLERLHIVYWSNQIYMVEAFESCISHKDMHG